MSVPYPIGAPGAEAPVTNAYIVTPSDTADLAVCPRCLILNEAGTVTMNLLGGTEDIAIPLQAGFNPIRPTRVYASGTAAVTIVAGY